MGRDQTVNIWGYTSQNHSQMVKIFHILLGLNIYMQNAQTLSTHHQGLALPKHTIETSTHSAYAHMYVKWTHLSSRCKFGDVRAIVY